MKMYCTHIISFFDCFFFFFLFLLFIIRVFFLSQLQESISGLLQIHCPTEAKHDGIVVTIEGLVNLMLGSKSTGIFEPFSNSIKPFQLLNSAIQLAGAGKLQQGFSELAFEFPLQCIKEPKILYETYHGIFININYSIKCDIKRSFLAKSVQKAQQFVIQYRPKPNPAVISATVAAAAQEGFNFTISPETLQKAAGGKERIAIPRFLITGHLDSTDCCITKPFTGHVGVLLGFLFILFFFYCIKLNVHCFLCVYS